MLLRRGIISSGILGGGGLWTPAEITTGAWFDAADTTPGNIVESGGLVSLWADKSGEGRDATQGTGSEQPTTGAETLGGLNVITGDGTRSMEFQYTHNQSVSFAFVGNYQATNTAMFQFGPSVSGNLLGFRSGDNTVRSKGSEDSKDNTTSLDDDLIVSCDVTDGGPINAYIDVFAICGFLSALAAVIHTARYEANPNNGDGMELEVIAAVVIGGTSLMGGRGSVVSTFFGVLIIAVLGAGLAQAGAQESTKRLITGCVIVAAVILDYYRQRMRTAGRTLSL